MTAAANDARVAKLLLLSLFLLFCVALGFLLSALQENPHNPLAPTIWGLETDWKDDLLTLYEEIDVGMSMDEVENLSTKYQSEHIHKEQIPLTQETERWLFVTPMAWNAKNWILVVDFEQRRVSKVAVRIEDNLNVSPRGGPPDKE